MKKPTPRPETGSRYNDESLHELDVVEEPEDATYVGHQSRSEPEQAAPVTQVPVYSLSSSPFVPKVPTQPLSVFSSVEEDDGPTSMQSMDMSFLSQGGQLSSRGRYEDLGVIAKGGMSYIHKALDQSMLRNIAMKVIDERLTREDIHTHRFVEEAQITGQLEHPNIVPVYEFGVNDEGLHYFTMRLVKGKTLKAYISSRDYQIGSETSLYKALQIFLRICDAISFAHSRGVVHLDLKPSNVMVGSHGQVYVMDWGIARVMDAQSLEAQGIEVDEPIQLEQKMYLIDEEESDVLGTWNYMAPEQALGLREKIGVQTDVFALGAILYEILTGCAPYEGELFQILPRIQKAEIEPAEERVPDVYIPVGLSMIAQRALSYDCEDRYPTVENLKEDVELFLRGGGQLPLRFFAAGDMIIREGEHGENAYIITKGHCCVFKSVDGRKMVLRQMKPGDVFGETAVFLGQKRTASVEALDEVTLAVVTRQTLEEKLLLGSWMERFVTTLASRFQEADQRRTTQSREFEQQTLINDLLTYLNLYNESASDFKLEARWSPFRDQLASNLECSPTEIEALVQRTGIFQLDLERDMLFATLSALHFHLKRRGLSF